MIRDENGDKNFEDTTEAMFFLGEWSHAVISWLKTLRDEYGIQLPMFPYYKARILDMAMVTKRFLATQKKKEDFLREKNRELSESNLCPRCQKPKT